MSGGGQRFHAQGGNSVACELTSALWGEKSHFDIFIFFFFFRLGQQTSNQSPPLLFPKPNVLGKQSTRQLNHALKWELFADLTHLSVSPAHFT